MNTNYTAEEILDRIFYKPEQSNWYKPVLKAMEEYATQAAAPQLTKGRGYEEVGADILPDKGRPLDIISPIVFAILTSGFETKAMYHYALEKWMLPSGDDANVKSWLKPL